MILSQNKMLMIAIVTMMILVSFSGFSIAETHETIDERDYTHTVLAEEGTATWCGHCPTVVAILDNIWESGEYDWNLVTLVDDRNTPYAGARLDELGLTGFPTVFYDGLYTSIVGSGASQSMHENTIDQCGARSVADIDIDLLVQWLGDAEMNIQIDVTNNEGSTYEGHVHAYVTEDYSRWYAGPAQYRFAMIGDYAYNGDVTIGASETWSQSTTWDGDTYGFSDITSDNIRVIIAVYDKATMRVDETKGMYPVVNFAPIADFSMDPESPDTDDTIQFTDSSTDSDGTVDSWSWDFGDGSSSMLQNPTHSYDEAGPYTITLTVEDDDGATGEISSEIVVAEPGYAADMVQSLFDRGFRMMPGWDAYQEFTPTFDTLSFVDLYLSKFGAPTGDIIVEVREDSGTGTVVYEGVISPDDVPSFPDYAWVSIECGNITVTPGETYCVILKNATGADTHNCMQWGWCDSYPSGSGGPYDGGWFYFRKEGNPTWSPIRDWDFTMITFSLN